MVDSRLSQMGPDDMKRVVTKEWDILMGQGCNFEVKVSQMGQERTVRYLTW